MDDIYPRPEADGARRRTAPKPDERLDISGVAFPFGLVLGKAALERLAAGRVLEIRLRDREMLQDLLMIVARSGDQTLAWEEQEEGYCLWVRRGSN